VQANSHTRPVMNHFVPTWPCFLTQAHCCH